MIRRTTPNKNFTKQKRNSWCCGLFKEEEKGELNFNCKTKTPSK